MEKKKEVIRKIENDIASHKWKTDLTKEENDGQVGKGPTNVATATGNRDYNLGTSLRNYVDPRVLKSWMNYVGLDWKRVLQQPCNVNSDGLETYSDADLRQYLPAVDEIEYRKSETVIQEESLAKS